MVLECIVLGDGLWGCCFVHTNTHTHTQTHTHRNTLKIKGKRKEEGGAGMSKETPRGDGRSQREPREAKRSQKETKARVHTRENGGRLCATLRNLKLQRYKICFIFLFFTLAQDSETTTVRKEARK